jgi:hypothetical protein
MQYIVYTITAIILYVVSDWIVNQIEISMGKRLKYRSVLFFVIIMTLAIGSFEIIDRNFAKPIQPAQQPQQIPAVK